MSQPPPYIRYQDFSDYQSANPDTPFPGSIIDTELDRIKTTTDALITNIALVQRDDGLLANGSVHPDSLSAATLDMISGWEPQGDWVTATAYVNSATQKDVVRESSVSYVCLVSHTSGVFATDLAAGKWQPLGQSQSAANVTVTPTGGIAAVNVQTALAELDTEKQPLDATLTALAGAATGANKLAYFSGVDAVSVADLTAAGRAILDDADAAAQRTTLGLGALATRNTINEDHIDADSVTNAQLAQMADATIKGRASGAGTGAPQDLTATQVRTAAGLGTIATQAADNVNITGGTISGVSGVVKAWVYSDNTGAIQSSFNVASIIAHGSGHYSIGFTNALASANYAIVGIGESVFGQHHTVVAFEQGDVKSTTGCQIRIKRLDVGVNSFFHVIIV